MPSSSIRCLALLGTLMPAVAACGGSSPSSTGATAIVTLDGSSTVFPISEAVAEEFQRIHPGVRVTVLGPPTLRQSEKIRKQAHDDAASPA